MPVTPPFLLTGRCGSSLVRVLALIGAVQRVEAISGREEDE